MRKNVIFNDSGKLIKHWINIVDILYLILIHKKLKRNCNVTLNIYTIMECTTNNIFLKVFSSLEKVFETNELIDFYNNYKLFQNAYIEYSLNKNSIILFVLSLETFKTYLEKYIVKCNRIDSYDKYNLLIEINKNIKELIKYIENLNENIIKNSTLKINLENVVNEFVNIDTQIVENIFIK